MFDEAMIHTLLPSFLSLRYHVTGERHVQVAAYSHHLLPVERCFANVCGYIRHHRKRQTQSAVDITNEAFWIYSIQGSLCNIEIIAAVFANLANLVNNQIIYAICPCMLLKQLKTIGEYMLEIIKTFSAR